MSGEATTAGGVTALRHGEVIVNGVLFSLSDA